MFFVQRRPVGRSEPIAIGHSELIAIGHSEPMTINRSEVEPHFDFHPLGIHNRDHLGTMIFITPE